MLLTSSNLHAHSNKDIESRNRNGNNVIIKNGNTKQIDEKHQVKQIVKLK